MGRINTLLVVILVALLVGIILTYIGRVFLQGLVQSVKSDRIIISGEARPEVLLRNAPLKYSGIVEEISLSDDITVALIDHAVYSGLGLALIDKQDNFIKWLTDAQLKYLGKGQLESAGEVLDWWILEDFDRDNKKELAIRFGIAGTAMVHPFYLYSYDGNNFKLLLKLVEASSKAGVRDLDGDGHQEITHDFSISGIGKLERDLLRWKDIWRLEDGRPVKVNSQFPQEYKDLIDLYNLALNKKEWIPDVSYYYPILECLKEKAEATIQKKQVEIKECQELLRKKYEQPNN